MVIKYSMREVRGVLQLFSKTKKADDLLDQAGHSIGIDLQDVKTVDSVTLGSWIRYYNRARKSGSQFFLLSPSVTVQHVLATTNLHTLFKIFDTENELT